MILYGRRECCSCAYCHSVHTAPARAVASTVATAPSPSLLLAAVVLGPGVRKARPLVMMAWAARTSGAPDLAWERG